MPPSGQKSICAKPECWTGYGTATVYGVLYGESRWLTSLVALFELSCIGDNATPVERLPCSPKEVRGGLVKVVGLDVFVPRRVDCALEVFVFGKIR